MKVLKNKKLVGSLLMSLVLLSANSIYANTPISDIAPNEQTQQKGFPEKINTFLELPGKRDVLEIPMQETYYTNKFVSDLASNEGIGKKMKDAFIEVTPSQQGIVTAKMKTTGRSFDMAVRDLDTGYYYAYNIANGYLTSTRISIPTNYDGADTEISSHSKVEYLQKKFGDYLIDHGYTNTTSTIGEFFNGRKQTYEKANIQVVFYEYGFIDRTFTITATKKDIQDNIEKIYGDTYKNDIALEYKNLDQILNTK